ncbi:unnamed protein product [Rotaria sp. Silwood2]|nr:unnamed protein product [Rotaria sp. Silwood2]
MVIWDNVFAPVPPIIANYDIAILWSNALNEENAREINNGAWNPNHFVPLTPEKETFKNNVVSQIRIPEFQSSPSRRLRSENNIGYNPTQSITSGSMQKEKNDKEQQRQIQLEKKMERNRSSRMNETEEQQQRQIRLEKQKKRSQTNRNKKKLEKQTQENIDTEQENNDMRVFIRPPWSEPIPRDLKETRLQQFLQQMSMSELAETTCAVCNIRTPAKDSKKLSISKIPNIHLLKVSEELNDLIINIQSPSLQHSRSHREISANNNNIKITGYAKTRPPDRIHLKKILTVRKKKIIRALHWLKNYNVLYQNVKINLENIAQLPEDDVPECNMSKLEQKLGDEELQSERVGYVPDPLFNPTEHTTADTIPINNSGVLDVNGASVSSEEIANYFLQKIKNNGNKGQMDIENVCLIPHSSNLSMNISIQNY